MFKNKSPGNILGFYDYIRVIFFMRSVSQRILWHYPSTKAIEYLVIF